MADYVDALIMLRDARLSAPPAYWFGERGNFDLHIIPGLVQSRSADEIVKGAGGSPSINLRTFRRHSS